LTVWERAAGFPDWAKITSRARVALEPRFRRRLAVGWWGIEHYLTIEGIHRQGVESSYQTSTLFIPFNSFHPLYRS
jgi:hypothetical protein